MTKKFKSTRESPFILDSYDLVGPPVAAYTPASSELPKRVTIHRHHPDSINKTGRNVAGKLIFVPDSMEELLALAGNLAVHKLNYANAEKELEAQSKNSNSFIYKKVSPKLVMKVGFALKSCYQQLRQHLCP